MHDKSTSVLSLSLSEPAFSTLRSSSAQQNMLISLKKCIPRRAKAVGHEGLAKQFDLKMLRDVGFIFMRNLKGQLKEVNPSEEVLCGCNQSKLDEENSVPDMRTEDLMQQMEMDRKQ